jgi:hypothetical protein
MMTAKERTCGHRTVKDELLPVLRGRVFHVTTVAGFAKIQVDGHIGTNLDGTLRAPQYRGYFRLHDCVSFFDLRRPEAEIQRAFDMQAFVNPNSDDAPIFLFLRPEHFDNLITWNDELLQKSLGYQIVWYIESGFPGSVSTDYIDDVLAVTIN